MREFSRTKQRMAVLYRQVVLLSIFAFSNVSQLVVAVAASSNSTDEISLALKASPTAVLNLLNATRSDERCVAINDPTGTDQIFCTSIENCSVEQAGYTYDTGSEGISPNGCNVSATFNGKSCDKTGITYAEEKYFIRASASCSSVYDGGIFPLEIGDFNTGAGCSGVPQEQICANGSTRNHFRYNYTNYDLQVEWTCRDDIELPNDFNKCSCSANLHNFLGGDGNAVCSSCSVCSDNDNGAFALTCNGLSVDCSHSYTFSIPDPLDSSGFAATSMNVQKTLILAAALCFWTVL